MVTVAKEEKNASPITRSLQIRTTTEKNLVDLISRPTKQEKKLQLQKPYFEKKGPKIKKQLRLNFQATFHKTFTYHDYNFTP